MHGIVARRELDGYVDAHAARASGSTRATSAAIRTSSPAASAPASASRARSRSSRSSWCATNRSRRSTSRSRRRCSTCSCSCARDLGLTYLFISHDLGVVEHLSDRIVIMYLGRVVEIAPTEELFRAAEPPLHPGAARQRAAARRAQAPLRRRSRARSPRRSIRRPGCHFHPRCPYAMRALPRRAARPKEIAPGRLSACHLNDAG